jgi:predicted PurR-regulated permease PerM
LLQRARFIYKFRALAESSSDSGLTWSIVRKHMSASRPDSQAVSPLVILAGVVLVLYFARAVLIPLALALTLTFLLTPMVMGLQKLSMRRVPAVAFATLISMAAVGGMGWVVAGQLIQVANDLPKYRLNIHHKIESLHYPPESPLGRAAESVKEVSSEFAEAGAQGKTVPQSAGPLPVEVVTVPASRLQSLRELLGSAVSPLATTGMIIIFTIFILIKQEDLRNRFLRLAGVPQLHAMTLALDEASHRISRYLLLQLLVNACYGICFGLGLYLIGIPNAILWGVIAGVLRIVPYVGTVTATAFPLALALAVFNGWGPPLLVLVLFGVLELIATNLVEPWLYSAHTGISSLALLVTTVFWTTLWGWAGLVLAIPLTVCVIVLGRYVPRMSFLHILLGDETALSVEAQFYQRLLALDQDDARMIANNFLRTHSLISMYDQVMIPALTLAEQDRHRGALDEMRESFLFLSSSEIVSEFAAYRSEQVPLKSKKLQPRWTANRDQEPTNRAERQSSAVRVFCLAANDRADEITSSMLAQLLERAGHGVLSLPVDSAFEEILTHLQPERQDVICISALPPFAFAQSLALYQRIRMHLPEIKILAGIWGFNENLEAARERFGSAPPDRVVASLASAVEQINDWGKAELASEVVSLPPGAMLP